MYKYLAIIIFCLVVQFAKAQTSTGTFAWDGVERDYILHLPTGYVEGEDIPLVFNFHGFGSNASEQVIYTNMISVANENKFAICYPNGINNAWNVGWGFGSLSDDVGFVNGLLDYLISVYSINSQRVYATGMSNGGFFSYSLACELSDRFAAIASVTGSMAPGYVSQCNPMRYIPIMQIHGTADQTVQYEGTDFISIPIEELKEYWTSRMQCSTPADTIFLEDVDMSDNCTAQRIEYTDCSENLEYVFYKIINGSHTWPGSAINFEGLNTNRDFLASEVIWEFFDRFEIPTSVSTIEANTKELNINIMPNPVHDILFLESQETVSKVEIFNLNGRKLHSFVGNKKSLDVSNLSTGVYLLKVNGLPIVERFVKL